MRKEIISEKERNRQTDRERRKMSMRHRTIKRLEKERRGEI